MWLNKNFFYIKKKKFSKGSIIGNFSTGHGCILEGTVTQLVTQSDCRPPESPVDVFTSRKY